MRPSIAIFLLMLPSLAMARPFVGADISMLLEIEKAGGVYRENGQPKDAIHILRDHGCEVFRLRLFVNPNRDYRESHGATQNLDDVIILSQRIKAVGGKLLLDLHYSDTWADPAHQTKPGAWEGLSIDDLAAQVYSYTRDVLRALAREDLTPSMVQVGNEITGGMLWPEGKVLDAAKDIEEQQWTRFRKLFNSGARAVRDASTPEHPIQVILHIHGGGREGLPSWFFSRLDHKQVDFDIIGLSCYPQWNDSLENAQKNVARLVKLTGKPVIFAEVSYRASEWEKPTDPKIMRWPQSPEGQAQFVRDLNAMVSQNEKILGYVWWYPEAIPVKGMFIWQDGAESLFDPQGNPRPAMSEFGPG
jgi:arabinogalactan endo-1,4-beta-galactosidase